jgi:hypothetical protein
MGAAILPVQDTLTGTIHVTNVIAGAEVAVGLTVTAKGTISKANTDDEDPYNAAARQTQAFTIWVHKLGPDGEALDGAQFTLLADDFGVPGAPMDDAVTPVADATGRFEIADLPAGTYWLRETTAPDGYTLLAQDVQFNLATTGAITFVGPDPLVSATASGLPDAPDINGTPADDTLAVTNLPVIILPAAGGTGLPVAWSIALALTAATGAVLLWRYTRRTHTPRSTHMPSHAR